MIGCSGALVEGSSVAQINRFLGYNMLRLFAIQSSGSLFRRSCSAPIGACDELKQQTPSLVHISVQMCSWLLVTSPFAATKLQAYVIQLLNPLASCHFVRKNGSASKQ